MALTNDPVLGYIYLEVAGFKTRANVFGCGGAIIATYQDTEIMGALAAASRLIEAYTNRDFTPNPQVERQEVDLSTGRIRVNKPLVVSIASAVLQTQPTTTTLDVTQLLIANQDNYVQIPFGMLPTNNPAGVVDYPDVIITYNSSQTLPPNSVIAATGFTAGAILIQDYANRRIPLGLNEISTEDQSVSRDTSFNMFTTSIIPQAAKDVLAGDAVASRRIVPQGYPSRTLRGLPQSQGAYSINKVWW